MTNEIALYCMKAYSEYYSEVCEECPIYGETGTDHCFEDALEMAIKALETIPKYKDAYGKGWDDGAKATNVDCGVVWEERIDAIKTDIDKQTEIHSDGEFYIKNIDVKRIIDKHCGGDNE